MNAAFPLTFSAGHAEDLKSTLKVSLRSDFTLCEISLLGKVSHRSFRRVAFVEFNFANNSWLEYRYDAKDYGHFEADLGHVGGLRPLLAIVSTNWQITNLLEVPISLPGRGQMEAFE
jgi:hypothetical protein